MNVGMLRSVGWSLVVITGMVSSAVAQVTRLPREAQPRPQGGPGSLSPSAFHL